MKRTLLNISFILGFIALIASSCHKNDPDPQTGFSTKADVPTISTSNASSVYASSAVVGGNISDDGGVPVIERGICISSTNPTPDTSGYHIVLGTGDGVFNTTLYSLSENTRFYFRAYAINLVGISYGDVVSFLTRQVSLAEVETSNVTVCGRGFAFCGGNVTNSGNTSVTERGICISSTNPTPTISGYHVPIGNGTGNFEQKLTQLNPGTLFYVRAYATNEKGTAYGDVVSFTTIPSTVNDLSGNVYNTLDIGTQCWLKENLKTARYMDGTLLTNVTSGSAWGELSYGAYCYYGTSSSHNVNFGKLYNYYAVSNAKGLCPTGWHVPTNAEWTVLINELGGSSIAGGKLKEVGNWFWNSPNTGATDEVGFSARGGGYRSNAGTSSKMLYNGYYWTSSQSTSTNAYAAKLSYNLTEIISSVYSKKYGFSVRCIKD